MMKRSFSDLAEADHPGELVEDFASLQLFFVPAPRLEGSRAPGNVARERQHHGHRMLGGGDHVAIRGVHHHDAAAGRLGNVHVVEADTGAPHHLEPLCLRQQVRGHLGGAADHQPIVIADDGFGRLG
jgi:hypothetical protein